MKKCVSLAVLAGLILALLVEAFLTLFQAFQEGRIHVHGPRRAWIPLPLVAADPMPLSLRRTTAAGERRRFGASPPAPLGFCEVFVLDEAGRPCGA
jgi:hypothetical protein